MLPSEPILPHWLKDKWERDVSRRRVTTRRSRRSSYAEWIRTNANLRLSGIIRVVGRSVSMSRSRIVDGTLKACLLSLFLLSSENNTK